MRTRNSHYPNNSPVTIPRRRNKRRAPNVDEPELCTIVKVALMADNRTMEELLRSPMEGYGEAIVIPEINADHFEIKTNLLQLVQASPFHGFKRDNPHTHINNFKRITSTLRFRDVAIYLIKLMMFPYSLEGTARIWVNTNSRESSSKTDERIDKLADQISTLVEIVSKKVVTPATVKAVEEPCVTCGGAHAYYNCPNTDSNQSSVCAATGSFFQNQASTSGTLPSNTIPNPKGEMKAITTRSGVAYEGPSIPTNPSPKKVVEQENEETTDKEQTNFQGSTAHIQPPVNPIPIPEPDVPKTLPKPNIPYPSILNDQKFREKASNKMEKIFQIFQDLRFDISFADALLLMPRFAPTIKNLLMNKEKLFELAKIPLNENFLAMLLKKLPGKLGDPGKFLIPCDFPGMDVCHALADLGASINLMPLSIWKKLSLPELTPTRMTLELADRSITRPKGLAEDIFVKVGSFHFPTDFVVVDFKADPRVSLILGRSFFRTGRALIDVYEGELILRNGDERLISHVYKHPQKHANESIKMINFIDVSCKDSFGEVLRLKKSNHFSSGSTTSFSDSRPSLTSFETSDYLLEEFADELALLDPFLPRNEDVNFESDLREIELLLNRDPSTDWLPKITIDPNPERFTNEPALVCLPPPGDDNNDKGCDLPFCDNKMIFSNPLFGFNDGFTSSDDEPFLKEDVQEESFQVYSNPLFEFDDNYNSSDINPLFNEMLEDVESKDSNVSNFDEPALLNTPLFDEDECFDPGGDINKIDAFLDDYNDLEGDVLEILHNTTHNLSPEVFFNHEPQCLKYEPKLGNMKHMVEVFDPGIWERIFSPSYVDYPLRIAIIFSSQLFSPSGVRTPFLTLASTLFIFLLLSRWHLNVKWKFALPLKLSLRTTKCGDRVKLCDSVTKNKALRGRHPKLPCYPHIYSFHILMLCEEALVTLPILVCFNLVIGGL
ncbi:reverse transcriptase domain-containing protein [Tanacetum coccineum]|uniref:Reverse transcriptase domain-containing protein n=1 Tax=Tanacetum coccineum TaxID=301880 RepID=A0ABQ5BTH1_9ASTR